MSKYKGLFTFDEDNHRYVPIAQADGIIDTMDYEPGSEPAGPLIKDEKIRRAVRAWAEAFGYKHVTHRFYTDNGGKRFSLLERHAQDISLPEQGLEEAKDYTIAELCGEEEE